MLKVREVQSESDLIVLVKNGFPSADKGLSCNLWNGRVFVGKILTKYSPGDLVRATRVGSENDIVIERLVKIHVRSGISGMSFIVLHPDRGDMDVLIGWHVN